MSPFSLENLTAANNLDALQLASPQDSQVRTDEETFQSHLRPAEPAEPPSSETPSDARDERSAEQEQPAARETRAQDGESQTDPETSEEETAADAGTAGESEDRSDDPAAAAPTQTVVIQQELAGLTGQAEGQSEVDTAEQETADDAADETAAAQKRLREAAALLDEPVEDDSSRQGSSVDPSADRKTLQQSPLESGSSDDVDAEAPGGQQAGSGGSSQEHQGGASGDRGAERGNDSNQNSRQTPLQTLTEAAAQQAAALDQSEESESSRQRQTNDDRSALRPVEPGAATAQEVESTSQERFAQHLLPRSQTARGRSSELTSVQQARFVDRVARAFHAAEGRGGTVRLKLHPPELGMLKLEVRVQGGALTARLEADTPLARTALLDNLPMLRDRLAEQGVRVEQFDVDLLDRQTSNLPDGLEQRDQDQEEHPAAAPQVSEEGDDAPDQELRPLPGTPHNEQLDVTI